MLLLRGPVTRIQWGRGAAADRALTALITIRHGVSEPSSIDATHPKKIPVKTTTSPGVASGQGLSMDTCGLYPALCTHLDSPVTVMMLDVELRLRRPRWLVPSDVCWIKFWA